MTQGTWPKGTTTPEVSFECPFCGRHCYANGGDEPGVVHVVPMCRKFEELDALEFMIACNDRFGVGRA